MRWFIDPVTGSMLALAILTAGAQMYMGYQASQDATDEQNRLVQQQEQARVAATQRELGMAQQKTDTALAGARTRSVNTNQSFSNQSAMGNLPAVKSQSAAGGGSGYGSASPTSAGTF